MSTRNNRSSKQKNQDQKIESPSSTSSSKIGKSTKKSRIAGLDEEKREKFLQRNRIAASRCRQKRKQWIADLERSLIEANERNKLLKERVDTLRSHLEKLKKDTTG